MVFLLIILAFAMVPLGGFHCLLLCTQQTTNEQLKISARQHGIEGRNPYTKGPFWNLASVFFGPRFSRFDRLIVIYLHIFLLHCCCFHVAFSWLRRTEKISEEDHLGSYLKKVF